MEIPQHIAIIMDGNGRWAKKRGFARTFGHRKGIERMKEIIETARMLGVKFVTFFAFSTENWNRPKKEIEFLFSYFKNFLKKEKNRLIQEGIRFRVIGRRDRIDKSLKEEIEKVEELTKNNKEICVNVALDYGGKWEIADAVKRLVKDIIAGKVDVEEVDEELVGKYLFFYQTEPDLLIRTSGEMRISNFLLWQLAYTELYFPKVLWPDFSKEELKKAIKVYSCRERRFGRVKDG